MALALSGRARRSMPLAAYAGPTQSPVLTYRTPLPDLTARELWLPENWDVYQVLRFFLIFFLFFFLVGWRTSLCIVLFRLAMSVRSRARRSRVVIIGGVLVLCGECCR